MTNLQALIELHAIQSFHRTPRPYGPGFFAGKPWLESGLKSPNRRTTMRLMRFPLCYGCGISIAGQGGEGDHIIPTKDGGPHGAENYGPMCSPCNSSKGARDLLEWWRSKERPVRALNPDIIVAYSRLMYRHMEVRGVLDVQAAPHFIEAIRDYEASLPSPAHIAAVRRAALAPLLEVAV